MQNVPVIFTNSASGKDKNDLVRFEIYVDADLESGYVLDDAGKELMGASIVVYDTPMYPSTELEWHNVIIRDYALPYLRRFRGNV